MTNTHIMQINEHDEVARTTEDDFDGDQQVVLRDFTGKGYACMTFLCPDVPSAEALVSALNGCKKKS